MNTHNAPSSSPSPPVVSQFSAFVSGTRVVTGTLDEVWQALSRIDIAGEQVYVFDEAETRLVDPPLGATPPSVVPPGPASAPAPAVGRPKLGVVAREVTLLPRHWEWLAQQPGGASAALRRLVEDARRSLAGEDARRLARERTFRFINAVAGNRHGFEEAVRRLYGDDQNAFAAQMAAWPLDVREYALALAAPAFAAAPDSR